MANLKKIWLRERCYGEPLDIPKQLRVDWDNDRHQGVALGINPNDPEPIALAKAMRDMADFLEDEFLNEKI